MKQKDLIENLDLCYSVFDSIILDRKYIEEGNIISWKRYQKGISKGPYVLEYVHLLSENQYSFLLEDKSFFQFFYEFDNEELVKAKLSYYPYPNLLKLYEGQLLEAMEKMQEMYTEGTDQILEACTHGSVESSNTSNLRFDYDKNVTSHSMSHLQFSGLNEMRITSEKIYSPFVFFDLILKNIDPINYTTISSRTGYNASLVASEKLVIDISISLKEHIGISTIEVKNTK